MKSLFTLLLSFTTVFTFAQDLKWAYSFQMPNNVRELAGGMSTNGTDRFAITGRGIQGYNLDVRNPSGEEYSDYSFIAVYNKDAKLIWQVSGPEATNFKQRVWNVHMAADGSVFGMGRFSGKEDFLPGGAKRELTASDLGSTYIQKFDKDGNLIWVTATPFPGIPYESVERPNGNLIVAGDNGADTSIKLNNGTDVAIYKGLYILELDNNGKVVNAGSSKGGFNNHYYDIKLDESGNVYLCGAYEGEMDFDIGSEEKLQTSHRSIDAFVASYDKDFNYRWHKSFGDVTSSAPPSWDRAHGLNIGKNGDVYVAGRFTYTTDFDPIENPGTYTLEADDRSQSPDGFIMKYTSSGELKWVKQLGGEASLNSYNTDVEVLHMVGDDKHLYVAGDLTGVGDFDPGTGEKILNAEDGATCIFYGQYDLDGNYEQAFIVDDTINDAIKSGVESIVDIEIVNGSLFAYGRFQKDVDFDPGSGKHILSTDPRGGNYFADHDIYISRWEMDTMSVGIANYEARKFVVYPNPSNGILNISNPYLENIDYQIVDLKGSTIQSGVLLANHNVLNLNEVKPGIYFLRIQGVNSIESQKLIIH